MENEINRIWKPIKGFEGIYELRDDGLIYIYQRKGTKGGYTYGYKSNLHYGITMSKEGEEIQKRVHILVYETFVGTIPKGYVVHHKNNNGYDNRVENLCLMLRSEHQKLHGKNNTKRMIGLAVSQRKSVIQYTIDGEYINEYESTAEASRQTGINQGSISNSCLGRCKTAGGFKWKYKEVA